MLTIKFELSEQDILALLKNEELTLTLKEDQSATETEHHSNTDNNSFFDFFEQNIKQLRKNEKMRTSETYRTALNSLQRFCGDKPLSISEVDAPFIQRYEQYLCANGLSKNTTSFYMRITRALFHCPASFIWVDRGFGEEVGLVCQPGQQLQVCESRIRV